MSQVGDDPNKVWAYGKVTPGWYVAKCIWDKNYAAHLQELGYSVCRSIDMPKGGPQ